MRDAGTLIKGGYVASLDPTIGEIEGGDVLIEGNAIVEVGRNIAAADADIIDARAKIVLPGLIDTHRHTWETLTRSWISEGDLAVYKKVLSDVLGPRFRPEDVYIGNLLGALGAINSGITTMLDWSHIMNSPAHADARSMGCGRFRHPRRVRLWLRADRQFLREARRRGRACRRSQAHPATIFPER